MTDKELNKLALKVLNGEYGNACERAQRLGPHYNAVQNRVNEMIIERSKEENRKLKFIDGVRHFLGKMFKTK